MTSLYYFLVNQLSHTLHIKILHFFHKNLFDSFDLKFIRFFLLLVTATVRYDSCNSINYILTLS